MVIIRESPRKQLAANAQWPPRSPHEALLSSPSGRKRYERFNDRRSVSPSPRKRPKLGFAANLSDRCGEERSDVVRNDGDEDEEEDEEVLQLKLAAIQAKLKLKKLQAAKEKQNTRSSAAETAGVTASKRTEPVRRSPEPRQKPVQVPLSPIRPREEPKEPPSPARLLGIDKGLRASSISLKRPGNSLSNVSQRLQAVANGRNGNQSQSTGLDDFARPMTFSERLAAGRADEKVTIEKEQRIIAARSKGFGLAPAPEMKGEWKVLTMAECMLVPPLSRPNQLPALSSTSQSTNYGQPQSRAVARCSSLEPFEGYGSKKWTSATQKKKPAKAPRPRKEPEPPSVLEKHSGIHVTKEILTGEPLAKALAGKQLYKLPRLLKEVKSPDYLPPDCEADYVVFGVIASKSEPLDHRGGPRSHTNTAEGEKEQVVDESRTKFMAITITDFKWELDLYLFDTGFIRYRKLPVGTVIAILNPGIMPPKKRGGSISESGAFSLKITSGDEDSILEIGRARDLGYCTAKKKDGSDCGSWINRKKTSVCDYHISVQVEKAKRGRMEINTMYGGKFGSYGGGGSKRPRGGSPGDDDDRFIKSRFRAFTGPPPKEHGPKRDMETGSHVWAVDSGLSGGGAASLLDADMELDVDRFSRGMSKEDLMKKRKKEKDKERELARRLGAEGKGQGGEYLAKIGAGDASKSGSAASTRQTTVPKEGENVDASVVHGDLPFAFMAPQASLKQTEHSASDLGLVRTAGAVKLLATARSAQKRKVGTQGASARASGVGALTTQAVGWGGAFRRGLLLEGTATKEQQTQQKLDKPAPSTYQETEATLSKNTGQGAPEKQVDTHEDDSDDLEII